MEMLMNFRELLESMYDSTLEYHDTLNPILWEDDNLKSEVASKLLTIAYTWATFSKIPVDSIKDIIFVGGNANYNYTSASDIDLHLVVDMKELGTCKEVIHEYLKSKKQLWGLIHDIKIYGHNVELYAQDVSVPYIEGQGVYSILNNKWLVKPKHQNIDFDDVNVQKKVQDYKKHIDTLISSSASDASFEGLKEKLRKMRASALEKGGEFAPENLAFKELRNAGYLDKLNDYFVSAQDKRLSLD